MLRFLLIIFAGLALGEKIASEFTVLPLKYYSVNFPVFAKGGNSSANQGNSSEISVIAQFNQTEATSVLAPGDVLLVILRADNNQTEIDNGHNMRASERNALLVNTVSDLCSDVPPSPGVRVNKVSFSGAIGTATLSAPVEETGIHCVVFVNCRNATGPLFVSANVTAVNPYGLLPAYLYPLLGFFAWTSLWTAVVLGLWCALAVYYRRDILPVQLWFTAVLTMHLIENATTYLRYFIYNKSGADSPHLLVFVAIVRITNQALTRVLVLIVCMGYGVVRPVLGDAKRHIAVLIVAYVVTTLFYTVGSERGSVDNISTPPWIILPLALVDTIIYLWMYSSLTETMGYLKAKRQTVKLLMFQKFTTVIIGTMALAAIMFGINFVAQLSEDGLRWQTLWLFDCGKVILQLVPIFFIAFVWRPNDNNKQYSFSEQLGQEMEDMEEGDESADDDGLFLSDDAGPEIAARAEMSNPTERAPPGRSKAASTGGTNGASGSGAVGGGHGQEFVLNDEDDDIFM